MTQPPPIVTIFGGSGFIGRRVAWNMAREGWRVRVAVRRPNDANFVRPYGDVGQVEPIQANIRDDDSCRRAMSGATAVVNCVGVLDPLGKQTFEAVQAEGPGRLARLASEAGIQRFVHISAICDESTGSAYAASKKAGEKAVREAFAGAVILRPSIVFGSDDAFFNRFAEMARFSPVIPVVGAETRFQPVFVDDVADAVVAGVVGKAEPGAIYELGGPGVYTFRELVEKMLKVIDRRRWVVGLPFALGRLLGWIFDMVKTASLGLIPPQITRDQVKQLTVDNVVSEGARTFADLGIRPTPLDAVLESYLYAYRPYGQYTAITASARNLKTGQR